MLKQQLIQFALIQFNFLTCDGAMLFEATTTILTNAFSFQAVEDRNSVPEPVLYLAIYLTKLALLENTRIPHFVSVK